jgi:hypothetical protein
MIEPVKYQDGMPVYTLDQVHMYGEPWLWGIDAYLVTSTFENEKPPSADWKFEQERMGSVRPIHRYIRQKRFEYTLYQLLGYRGNVPRELVDLLEYKGYNRDPRHVWESIRQFIKEHNFGNIYYNRIPTIIQMLGLNLRINIQDNSRFITDIINEFKVANHKFEQLKIKPKYFPNLRYIALKFLEKNGADFEFYIPLIRTKRKLAPLEEIWEKIIFDK